MLVSLLLFALSIGPADLAQALVSGEEDPVRFNYGRLLYDAENQAVGNDILTALQRDASMEAVPVHLRVDGARYESSQSGCELPSLIAGVELVRAAPDQETYDAARALAVEAYDNAAARLRERLASSSDIIEAIEIRDAFWRDEMTEPRNPELSSFENRFIVQLYYQGVCRADFVNAAVLREMIEAEDEFIETFLLTEDVSRLAVLNHAPHSMQVQILDLIANRPDFGDDIIEREAEARMVDSVSLYRYEPQVYGTQYTCVRGRAVLAGRYDLHDIAENRAQLGLDPLDTGAMQDLCAARIGAASD